MAPAYRIRVGLVAGLTKRPGRNYTTDLAVLQQAEECAADEKEGEVSSTMVMVLVSNVALLNSHSILVRYSRGQKTVPFSVLRNSTVYSVVRSVL